MFSQEEYYGSMLVKLEQTFNQLFPYGILITFVAGIARLVLVNNDLLGYAIVLFSFFMILVFFMSNQSNPKLKIYSLSTVSFILSMLIYFSFGVNSMGVLMMIISNFITLIFGSTKIHRFHFALSILSILYVFYHIKYTLNIQTVDTKFLALHLIAYILIVIILKNSLLLIKEYIASNTENLNMELIRNENILNELAIQNAAIKSNEKEIYTLAFFDQLSGLPKRNLFEKEIATRLAIVDEGTMVLADLREFKLINSIYGSKIGDKIIETIGGVANDYKEKQIFISRINGNEFSIWFETTNIDEIKRTLLNLNKKIQEKLKLVLKHSRLKFHISYAQYPENGDDFVTLYNKANIALNYGKEMDIQNLIPFEEFMEEKILYDSNFKRVLEEAILDKSFTVHYQEQYDSEHGHVIGLEALARWLKTPFGPVSPGQFIPIVSKYHMMEIFEQVIIEKVMQDFEKIKRKYGTDIKVGINISPEYLVSQNFIPFINEMKTQYNVDPESIIIEITEEVMIKGIQNVESILNELRSHGYKISLDDFGSGYSSLNYLARLPFDEIKIDKAFVDEIHKDKVRRVLKTIIELKIVYDVDVIAEGVENEQQLSSLQSIGCYKIQGYLHSKPEPLN